MVTISSITPWNVDIVNYLACGILPPDMNYQERKNFLYDVILGRILNSLNTVQID